MTFDLATMPDQTDRIAIVTGANSGLGLETTRGLASIGATVIMACRNLERAETARAALLSSQPEARLEVLPLDLSSLASVRQFSETFLRNYDRLDLLINNAGIMVPPYAVTEDGFESQLGANHLGHFLLTGLLQDPLHHTPGARVVSLSSIAHRMGKIYFDDLNSQQRYSAIKAYGQSKLACLLFARELDRRATANGVDITSVAAHPGVSPTNLAQHLPKLVTRVLMPLFAPLFTHDPKAAAQPTLMAALDPEVKGADYVGPTGFREMKGPPGKVKPMKHGRDDAVAARLWQVSEELVDYAYLS